MYVKTNEAWVINGQKLNKQYTDSRIELTRGIYM